MSAFVVPLASYFLVVNVVAFVLYGLDKYKARRGKWRVAETTLLWVAAVGGCLGAWAGMKVWRHKTRHKKFTIGVPLMVALYLTLCVGWAVGESHDGNVAPSLQQKVDSLVSGLPMEVGVAVSYRGENICTVNGDVRFPMMSVFKLHQAVAIADTLARSGLSADTRVWVSKDMLRENTYSPMREEYPGGNIRLSIARLMRYSLLQSDNNACDILFSLFGGTDYVQSKMEAMGLRDTRIRWTEDEMHRDVRRTSGNYTTPKEALKVVEVAWQDKTLNGYLTECMTGRNRIPALLPKDGIVIGHKTGTGDAWPDGTLGGINDVGFVVLPDGEPFFLAVFCNRSSRTLEETEAVIAEIARLIYDVLTRQ